MEQLQAESVSGREVPCDSGIRDAESVKGTAINLISCIFYAIERYSILI
jgi:hypothetical protein